MDKGNDEEDLLSVYEGLSLSYLPSYLSLQGFLNKKREDFLKRKCERCEVEKETK
jgi:hypothetical protein